MRGAGLRALGGRRSATALAAGLALALAAGAARGHDLGLSYGDYALVGDAVRVELVFAHRDLIGLVAGLDADHDGALSPAELDAAREALAGAVVGRVKVEGDGVRCPGELGRAEIAELDGVVVRAAYRCGRRPASVTVALAFLPDLRGHRHLGRAHAGGGQLDLVLTERFPTFSFVPPAEALRPGRFVRPAAASALFALAASALVRALRERRRRALVVLGALAAFAAAVVVLRFPP